MALQVPIQESLLRYSDSELNELATKNFKTLMRFMGDQSKLKNQNEVNCIYEILKEKENLHDEVYCQVIKQVTHNPNQESVLRGWLLLNLLTGYFLPSNILMPYATKFLQLASSDPSSTHHGMTVSKQLWADGIHVLLPKDCPLQKGHGARRLVILMPGGVEYLTRIKTFTVCRKAPVPGHRAQPTLSAPRVMTLSLCKHVDKMVRPIRSEEYLHDYLLEDNLVTVTLRRLIWRTPLHFENKIYTDVHYGQVSNKASVSTRNVLSRGGELVSACWHREELNEYTPKTLQSSIRVQALETWEHLQLLAISGWCSRLPAQSCCLKATFCFLTEHMMKLPFFGYNIYFVERVSDDTIPVPCFFGVNKEEIIVVDDTTQAVSCVIPLKELQKMRTLRPVSDGGLPGIELNYGSAASPKTMWFELSQVRSAWTHSFLLVDGCTAFPRPQSSFAPARPGI
uniref:MyTH4 domain-containing protein n=1 Tax=Bubo bubo TaxID=30461 RepID=A0A8C0E9P7_BUBBB